MQQDAARTLAAPRRLFTACRTLNDSRTRRIRIEDVWPSLDCGRYPVKRTLGERVEVWADVIRDGHEQLGAAVRVRPPGKRALDRGADARTSATTAGRRRSRSPSSAAGSSACRAWVDRYASWRDEIRRKVEGGQTDLASELAEGSALLGRELATAEEALASTETDRSELASLDRPLEVDVDPQLARFGSWYELFPRSWGGFKGVEKILPRPRRARLRRALPPADPPDRRLAPQGPQQRDEGEAEGSRAARGRSAPPRAATPRSSPGSGTMDDFERLVASARGHGIEIALDFAIQCSPDHPWLTEHPEWFRRRPDGTIKYAENPPKSYQDIVNVDFDTTDREALWTALRDVVLFWVERGVRVYRVDNPHTKPLPFWEWLIREVRERDPRVIFLAEAFTRPKLMARAREGRLQPVLHVLHVEEHALGAAGVPHAAHALDAAGVLPAELLREHAGHPPRVPPARRPAGLRGPARARRDALADVRHLLGLRALRERAGARGQRGVPELREVRGQAALARRAAAAARAPAERDQAREPEPPAAATASTSSRPSTST